MTVRKAKSSRAEDEVIDQAGSSDKTFSVSVFLDLVNTGLRTFRVRLKGEVSSATERGGHWYFDLKDKEDGSVISCLIWKNNFRLSGVALTVGMEIVAVGSPAVYKPNGRLSFQAESIELVGEGALQKQFEELKAKLAKEGLFATERKRSIPLFPVKIGLITSRQGEAIHDFLTNLGRFGFQISFIDSRVEGAQAVPSLIAAIKTFRRKDIDVLVLVRGGGSLESLLSFNNETLVREVANFPKPVVSGIGHEQDVSLVDLAADRSCSTPTGAAKLLSYSWEQAQSKVDLADSHLRGAFRERLLVSAHEIERSRALLEGGFRRILELFRDLSFRLREELSVLGRAIGSAREAAGRAADHFRQVLPKAIKQIEERLSAAEKNLSLADPARQLRLGYSLAYKGGKLMRSVSQVSQGDEYKLQLRDGEIYSAVKKIEKHGNK